MIAKPPIKRIKKSRKEQLDERGLIYCLSDLNIIFSESLLDEVTELYERGYKLEEIGNLLDRDPDEIFIGLFHQARNNKIKRTFAYRMG